MKKKLLLSSVAALTLFAAYNTASAERNDPGIRYSGESLPTKPNGGVQSFDENGNVVNLTASKKKYEVRVNKQGVRAVASETEPFTFDGEFVGWDEVTTYADGSTSTVFIPKSGTEYKPADAERNPYDVRNRIGKDGKPLPEVFANGTHVRVHVRDQKGASVEGVQVSALIYKSKAAYEAGEPALNVKHTEVGVTDASGDVEFPVAKDGYVLFRVDNAPKGYFVPKKLVLGTELDAEEVTQDGKTMFVNGELVVEKTDSYNVAKEEWVQEEAGWKYYVGNKFTTNWKQVDGKWYFFNAEGVMQKWWVQDNGTWYYLNGAGEMQTGWLQDNGTWYYLEASGAMKASQWFEVDGKWYYVDATGALAVNTTVDGYTVNANGEWV